MSFYKIFTTFIAPKSPTAPADMKTSCFSLLLILISFVAFSQPDIKIIGKAYDAHTREPLPFINIYLNNTTAGTTTDIDGHYTLETKKLSDTIVASSVGYEKMAIKITSAPVQVINFEMERTSIDIAEVVVVAGENPAHILLRNIIRNKELNNKEKLDLYQYEVYNKLEIDVDNINRDAIEKRRLLKPFAFILDNIDSSNVDEKPFLPIFLTETLSDFYYRKTPKGQREMIKGSRISGVKDETISQFLGSMYQDINIYENWIPILGKNFVSPISDYGLGYYKYYLIDSSVINGKWCYKINFKPKRKQENTFFGDFWVNDTSFAIKKISMQMSHDVNMNFVEKLSVFQEFMPVAAAGQPDSTGMWMLVKDKLIIDFVSAKKVIGIPGKPKDEKLASMGLIGRKTTSYKDIIINDTATERHFAQAEDIVIAEGADEKDENYWNSVRHDTLSGNEKKVYAMVDTIKKIPLFRTYIDVVTFIVSGYKTYGKLDFGPYFNILSNNSVEGWRLRMGITTNKNFSERWLLKTFVAYGLKDDLVKYGGSVDYIVSNKPWQKTGISYKNDYNLQTELIDELGQDNLFSSVFRRGISQKLIRTEEKKFYYERDWRKGWSNRFVFSNQIIDPAFDFSYKKGEDTKTTVTTTELMLNTRFAYKEKYVQAGYNRISISGKYPVVQFQYVLGVNNFLESDFEYHKFLFSLYDYLYINPIGMLYYNVTAGKITGTLPYLLLENHRGNQTFYYDKYVFNTMKYYEFASDQYVSLAIAHYFGGLIFNRIPLFRKLKWRELISAKAVLGDLSPANRFYNSGNAFKVPYPEPFVEAGCGIENIFKFIRIDALWRLTHLQPLPGENAIPKFGIYGSIQIEF